jgi:hypothetical protein
MSGFAGDCNLKLSLEYYKHRGFKPCQAFETVNFKMRAQHLRTISNFVLLVTTLPFVNRFLILSPLNFHFILHNE